MNDIAHRLNAYIQLHPFDPGGNDYEAVPDQLYQTHAESHESTPPEISEGFKELEDFLCALPFDDNNAVFNLYCRLCSTYERKAFIDGILYGVHLLNELLREGDQ